MPDFHDIEQIHQPSYNVDIPIKYLNKWMDEHNEHQKVNLDPIYQRDHVWTQQQEIAYVEWILKGGVSANILYWNCADWGRGYKKDIEIVDGKQRITALLKFVNNEIPVFGHFYDEWEGKSFLNTCTVKFCIANFQTQKQVMQWYLDLNSGGTVHKPEEIQKVKDMLQEIEQ